MIKKDKIATISDILNIAPSTVRRFFSHPEKLHAITFRQIVSILSAHYPEELRKLAEVDTRDILLIIPSHRLLIVSDIIKKIQELGLIYNFALRIYENNNLLPLEILFEKYKKKWDDIRGVITLSSTFKNVPEGYIIPTVFLNTEPQSHGACINVNDYIGGRVAIEHLINNGWKKPLFITYSPLDKCAKERHNGAKLACEEFGVEFQMVTTNNFSMDGAYEITKNLITSKRNFDSIFYVCDEMAIGGLQSINKEKLVLGSDIGIIGFDNLEISKFLGISSVDQALSQKMTLAIEYILYGNGKQFNETLPELSYTPIVVERYSSKKI